MNDIATSENKKDFQFFITRVIQKATETITSAFKEYNEKYVLKIEDTLSVLEGFIELGRNFIENIPLLETVEEKISTTIKIVANQMNLPTKQDVEKLISAMEDLNSKIEALNNKYSI